MNYKKTLNLPKTDFSMRAQLPKLEPRLLDKWQAMDLYGEIRKQGQAKKPRFILHDGPPYANGHVHLGTALNKILKDFVVKSQTMMGKYAPYVPGWDCHGMPIEHNVIKDLGAKAVEMSKLQIRKLCRKYADKYLNIQRGEFIRLGCLGDWFDPYITMSKQYESETVAALGDLVKGGFVERGLRPIHWCGTCKTALAEAELEYHEHTSPSIFVKFKLREDDKKSAQLGLDSQGAAVLIWTTTPWTIPANLAIALHPEFQYVFVKVKDETILVAHDLLESVSQAVGWENPEIVAKLSGKELDGMRCVHPMFERDSVIIMAEYVTLEAGTGCVHTAPGHGAEDFESGKKYGLEILSPVDDAGRFTSQVAQYEGLTVFEANQPITEQLESRGALASLQTITHSYPFCWRCKQPVIFRATEQWFVNVDANSLRQNALAEIDKVKWIPPWGRQRIFNMVETRPDWCLSRQRSWGVPIPALRCRACSKSSLTSEVISKVCELVAERGTDVWYEEPTETFLPDGFSCPECGAKDFVKEEDILDVWFDSSVSQRAVLEHHKDLSWPCDLYLEATDQHRGWFQVSLLTAVGTRNAAPYRQVLTHGLILDESSKKMSKSLGNVIAPQEVIDKYGADVLRMFLASVDYTSDITFSRSMLDPISDAYRKVRNTLRFMLGNLKDFDPDQNGLAEDQLEEVDRWMLARMRERVAKIRDAYAAYQFHVIHHMLLDLCTVDLSAFYLDVIKDRLYVEAENSPTRRSAQTAIYQLTNDLICLLAPILSFTAEEAWGYLRKSEDKTDSVHLAELPAGQARPGDQELLSRFARLRRIRAELNKAMDVVLKDGLVRSSLDTRVTVCADDDTVVFIGSFIEKLPDLFKVVALEFKDDLSDKAFVSTDIDGLKIEIIKASEEKCDRCWNRREDVGRIADKPDLCARCIAVMKSIEE
ncbi:MAG: isoleucine--tRNA ligase [Deltaproteobacteria bacterium]|nr:isoleucine--tRNA ligase [Deltaproteobacteria bacterium]